MGAPTRYGRGEIVIAPIPYALSTSGLAGKLRPALVIAILSRSDLLVCQITSQPAEEASDVGLLDDDFISGGLRQKSTIRASRIFVIRGDSVAMVAGKLSSSKFDMVIAQVVRVIEGSI